jgi:putative endonuclease
MFYVYAISSLKRNYIYVGLTSDVKRRIGQHNNGTKKTTRPYIPFRLIFVESCMSRIEARRQEKYWKSGTGKEQLRVMRDSDR